MVKERILKIDYEYIFTQEQIKEALNLKGDLKGMDLHEGLTPTEEDKGKHKEKTRWSIFTEERSRNGGKR